MITVDTNCTEILLPEVMFPEKNLRCGVSITSTPIRGLDFDFSSFFSFDTLVFSLFLDDIKTRILHSNFCPLSEHIFYRPDETGTFKKFNYTNFQLLPEVEFDQVKSFEKGVKFCVREDGQVTFQLSVPKLYYGTNLFLFYDFEKFFRDFYSFFSHYVPGVQSFMKWVVKRVDWCVNFNLGDCIDDLLSYLSKCDFRGRKGLRKGGKEYPYWIWRGRTLKFYDKFKEMIDNKKHHDMSYIDMASGIFRMEEEWRQDNIKHKLGVDKISDCTVARFLVYLKGFNFPEKLESIFKNILFKEKEDVDLTIPEVQERIYDFYKSSGQRNWRKFGHKTVRFYEQALFSDREELYKKYGKDVIYRREKFFRDLGIPLRWGTGRDISNYLFDYSLFSFDKICYFKEAF